MSAQPVEGAELRLPQEKGMQSQPSSAANSKTSPHQELGSEADSSTSGVSVSKHPLQHTWCLWVLLRNECTKDWQGSQMNVHTFNTIEDFWRLFHNIRRPSKLGIVDLSMFKKDITPAWEDETCKQGGRWIAKIDKIQSEDLDDLWLNLVLTIIGENFEELGGRSICGAVVSSRPGKKEQKGNSKVALWLSEKEEAKVMPIGKAFSRILQEIDFSGEIHFEDFTNGCKSLYTLNGK